MGMPPRPPMMAPPSMTPRMNPADEPPNKKAKSEDNLMPESLWLAQHNSGPITDKVVIPQDSSKPEWNNNGQTLTLTLPLSDLEKTMEEELTCMICQELLIEATNLNCAHTFCSFCLQVTSETSVLLWPCMLSEFVIKTALSLPTFTGVEKDERNLSILFRENQQRIALFGRRYLYR